jgi:hypothetical protein
MSMRCCGARVLSGMGCKHIADHILYIFVKVMIVGI